MTVAEEGGGDELHELVSFLSDKRVHVQQGALALVVGLTGSPDGLDKLAGAATELLPALLRLLPAAPGTSRSALTALVNLCQAPGVVERLLDHKAVDRVMDYLQEGACPHVDLMTMLLANLTAPQAGTDALLHIRDRATAGLYLAVLLRRFLDSAGEEPDACEHVALVLTNATRSRAARALLLEPGRGVLGALAAQLAPDRSGADGVMGRLAADAGVLGAMLDALCGWERPADGDRVVREALAEALLMLAEDEEGRTALWSVKAPEKLRKGYELEEDAEVCGAMERMAQLFLQDGFRDGAEAEGPTSPAASVPASAG